MLQPKRTTFRKAHKGRIKGIAKGGFTLSFGGFGLKALEPERVTARQIEAEAAAREAGSSRATAACIAGSTWVRTRSTAVAVSAAVMPPPPSAGPAPPARRSPRARPRPR